MLRVALTGGLASGKSFVGKVFEGYGCCLVRADALGHEVLGPGGEAYDSVVEHFGSGILDKEGRVDRRALARIVFANPEKLALLNGLVHPPVRRRTERILADFAMSHPRGIAIVEAAIHIETGNYRNYERLILACCTPEQQLERAMHRDGLSRQEVEERLSRQMPLHVKRKYAHYVIDTSGTKDETVRLTEEVFRQLQSIPQ
jgi:dephospho-CoA kinase